MDNGQEQLSPGPASQVLEALQAGLPKPGPGRLVDIDAETAEDPRLDAAQEEDLAMLARQARKRPGRATPPQDNGSLPIECTGLGCYSASLLKAFADKCGADRQCWRDAMAKIRKPG